MENDIASEVDISCARLLAEVVDAISSLFEESENTDGDSLGGEDGDISKIEIDWDEKVNNLHGHDDDDGSMATLSTDVEDLESTVTDGGESLDGDDCKIIDGIVDGNSKKIERHNHQSPSMQREDGGTAIVPNIRYSGQVGIGEYHREATDDRGPLMDSWGRRSNLLDQQGQPQRITSELPHYICQYKSKYSFYFDLIPGRYPQFVRKVDYNHLLEIWRISFNIYSTGIGDVIVHLGEIHAFYQMEQLARGCEPRWAYKDFNFYPNSMDFGFEVDNFTIADIYSRLIKFLCLRDNILKQFPYVDVHFEQDSLSAKCFQDNVRKMMGRLKQVHSWAVMRARPNNKAEAPTTSGGGGGGGGAGAASTNKGEQDESNNNLIGGDDNNHNRGASSGRAKGRATRKRCNTAYKNKPPQL